MQTRNLAPNRLLRRRRTLGWFSARPACWQPLGMSGIARMFHAGPEAQRGTAGAMRHAGARGVEVFARCRCQSEVTQELPQNSDYGLDEPIRVCDGIHMFFLWLASRTNQTIGLGGVDVRATTR